MPFLLCYVWLHTRHTWQYRRWTTYNLDDSAFNVFLFLHGSFPTVHTWKSSALRWESCICSQVWLPARVPHSQWCVALYVRKCLKYAFSELPSGPLSRRRPLQLPAPIRSTSNANAQRSGWCRAPLVVRLVFHFNVLSERFACAVIPSGCWLGGTSGGGGGGWVRGEAN